MQLRANREYKDRLFRLLFGTSEQKANILSLYNALNGTSYSNEDDIEINTLEDTIFLNMKNDVSFIIDDRMPLWEQQSTYNPNMPVRGLIYYGKLYDKYLSEMHRSIYGKTLLHIPTPKFVVFYNGDDDRPAVEELKLSTAFTVEDKSGDYEWTATVYNLNKSENAGLLAACKPLADYTELVNRIKKNRKNCVTKEDAARATDEAVRSCIADGILCDFLIGHRAEVMDVILTEFDEAKFIASIKMEEREEGIQEGLAKGRAEGRKEEIVRVVSRMLSKGRSIEDIADDLDEDIETVAEIAKSIE